MGFKRMSKAQKRGGAIDAKVHARKFPAAATVAEGERQGRADGAGEKSEVLESLRHERKRSVVLSG